MNLKIKKLMQMDIGVFIEVRYDETKEFSGEITEKDDECLVIVSEGEELCLEYEQVNSYRVIKNDDVKAGVKQENEKTETDVTEPKKEKAEEPGKAEVKKIEEKSKAILENYHPPFEIEIRKESVSDGKIKQANAAVEPNFRKKLQSRFDSFLYALSSNDKIKATNVYDAIYDMVYNDAGLFESKKVWNMLGLMSLRCSPDEEDMQEALIRGGCFRYIAERAYFAGDYAYAAAYGSIGVCNEADEETSGILYTIIFKSCVLSEDASAVSWLIEKTGFTKLNAELLSSLYNCKKVALKGGFNFSEYTKNLSVYYPEASSKGKIDEIINEYDLHIPTKKADVSSEKDVEKTESYIGKIITLKWSRGSGTILYQSENDMKTCTFSYGNITDKKLSDRLSTVFTSDVESMNMHVKFSINDSGVVTMVEGFYQKASFEKVKEPQEKKEPVQAKRAENASYVEQGRYTIADRDDIERFRDAADLFEKAILAEQDMTNAIGEFAGACLAYKNASNDTQVVQEYLNKAYEYCNKYDSVIKHDLKYDLTVLNLMTSMGDKKGKRKCLERLVSNDNVVPTQKLYYISTLAEFDMKEGEETGNKESFEEAKKGFQNWESIFLSNAKLYSMPAMVISYHKRILVNLAICLIKLDEKEQAERILAKVIKKDPGNVVANNLLQSIKENYDSEDEEEFKAPLDLDEEELVALEAEYEEEEDEDELFGFENAESYVDVASWEDLGLSSKDVVDYAMSVSSADKNMYFLSYLKAATLINKDFAPIYSAASVALDNPIENIGYSAAEVQSAFSFQENTYSRLVAYCLACAGLRSAFYDTIGTDYMLNSLCSSVQLRTEYPDLHEIMVILSGFKNQYGKGVDSFAAYRLVDKSTQEGKINNVLDKIKKIYEEQFYNKIVKESKSQLRFKLTKVIVYEKGGILETVLRSIIDNNIEEYDRLKNEFSELFIRNSTAIQRSNIDKNKIEKFIDICWARAGDDRRVNERKSSTLMSDLRNNLRVHVTDIVGIICEWAELRENGLVAETDSQEKEAYAIIEHRLVALLKNLSESLREASEDYSTEEITGRNLLAETADELARKLTGEWDASERKYYFADFLLSNQIMLDENYIPDFSGTFCSLSGFNILARIRRHIQEKAETGAEAGDRVYSRNRHFQNFGSAKLLAQYTQESSAAEPWYLQEDTQMYEELAEGKLKASYRQFIEDIQLASGKGQIMLYDEFMNNIDDIALYWLKVSIETKNYGFFFAFMDACKEKIREEASGYEDELIKELELMIRDNPELFLEDDTKQQIEAQIRSQNFLVAEDWMNRLRKEDFYEPMAASVDAIEHLKSFWEEYDANYESSKDASATLRFQVNKGGYIAAKDKKGGMSLINNWLSNGSGASAEKIQTILNALGWDNIEVTECADSKYEEYIVENKAAKASGKKDYSHPIAAFGTNTKKNGFRVICSYGFTDADRLMDLYRELESTPCNKIILLDYALNVAERRRLARKIKETPLANAYIVIDRVALVYLANHYVGGANNRILMAITMPFAYLQPYIESSSFEMPPEMFIGRKDELLSIESPTGTNIIYGGRQLGKSALLKKARNDIDNDSFGRRAAFIDINGKNYEEAATTIYNKLIEVKILSGEDKEFCSWDELEKAIKNRLADEENPISYLLLMLDEADSFIHSSKGVSFLPIVKLKDIQQSSNGQFKFVLAGLHDIVKFNRDVALGHNSVITHLSDMNIKPFRYEEAKELLIKPLSYLGFSFEDDDVLISQILAATNYFPGLIQLYCEKLIEAMRVNYAGYNEAETPPYIVTETHIKKVLSDKDFRENIRNKLEITLTLDNVYKILALLIAMLEGQTISEQGDENFIKGCSAEEIRSIAYKNGIHNIVDLDAEEIEALLCELCDLNILKSVSEGKYTFCTKNFRDMLGSAEEIEDELIELI